MRNFIQNKLRIVLEQQITEVRYSKERDLKQFEAIVKYLKEKHGRDPYFLDVNDGQWVGNVFINIHGKVKIQRSDLPADVVRDRGDMVQEKANWLRIDGINAGRGIEHPDTYSPKQSSAQTRYRPNSTDNTIKYETVYVEILGNRISIEVPVAGSPASDAAIKAYIAYENEIRSLIKRNMEGYSPYTDDKAGAKARADQYGDKYTQMRKSEKLKQNIEKEMKKRAITADPEKYFDEYLYALKSMTDDRKQRRIYDKLLRAAERVKNLFNAGASKEKIQQEIIQMNAQKLFNQRIKGVNDEVLKV
jgi:hypothetical protein